MKNINFKLKFWGGFCLLKNKNAFTLVEIIVAVTILIILTSILFLYYSTYAPKARDVVRNQDLVNISDVMDNALSAWKYSFNLIFTDWIQENSINVNSFTVNPLPIAYGCSNNMDFWTPYYDRRGWLLINSNPLSMNWSWDIWVYVKNYKKLT